jgi:hypothetical protein
MMIGSGQTDFLTKRQNLFQEIVCEHGVIMPVHLGGIFALQASTLCASLRELSHVMQQTRQRGCENRFLVICHLTSSTKELPIGNLLRGQCRNSQIVNHKSKIANLPVSPFLPLYRDGGSVVENCHPVMRENPYL